MAIYYGDGGSSSVGRVVQVAHTYATGEDS